MNKRLAKKIPHEWTRATLGERRQPNYTREQLGRARQRLHGGAVGAYGLGLWPFGRKAQPRTVVLADEDGVVERGGG